MRPKESIRLARTRSGLPKPPTRRATAQASSVVASSMPPIHDAHRGGHGEDAEQANTPFTVTLVTGVISQAMLVTLNP